MSTPSLEQACLLTLTRAAFDVPTSIQDKLQNMPMDRLDWHWIIKQAIHHRVGATVSTALKDLGYWENLPTTEREKLEIVAFQSRQRMQYFRAEVKAFIQQFTAAHIPVGVLRGAAIATLYNDSNVRYYKDVDLLIDQQDHLTIHQILERMGYIQGNIDKANNAIIPASATEKERQFQEKRLHPYLKPAPELQDFYIIEPHINFFEACEPYQLPMKQLVSKIGGEGAIARLAQLPTLPPEEFLLELCIHIHSHAFALPSLRSGTDLLLYRWLDLAVVLGRLSEEFSWERFYRMVKEMQVLFPVAFSLVTLRQIYAISVPEIEQIIPLDFEQQSQQIWYFDVSGAYVPVTSLKVPHALRLFDRSPYRMLLEWEKNAAFDESSVLHPHAGEDYRQAL